jgi:hypothetical protein
MMGRLPASDAGARPTLTRFNLAGHLPLFRSPRRTARARCSDSIPAVRKDTHSYGAQHAGRDLVTLRPGRLRRTRRSREV